MSGALLRYGHFMNVYDERILSGEFSNAPEQVFYLIGAIDEAVAKQSGERAVPALAS